jgi:hypothetical protein
MCDHMLLIQNIPLSLMNGTMIKTLIKGAGK